MQRRRLGAHKDVAQLLPAHNAQVDAGDYQLLRKSNDRRENEMIHQ
jgi:hypothetical protein